MDLLFTPKTGQSPLTAVRHLSNLRLLPAVFSIPESAQQRLGEGYGSACLATMAAADSILQQWQPQV